jgi:hypothetical protein
MFRHPNYYKKLRASRREKAISPDDASTDEQGRTPKAASVKRQAIDETVPHCDIEEAASDKLQASSNKLQASGQASSNKR